MGYSCSWCWGTLFAASLAAMGCADLEEGQGVAGTTSATDSNESTDATATAPATTGSTTSPPSTSTTTTVPTATDSGGVECGNGVIEPGEDCDDGDDNSDSNRCKPDCTTHFCGDGITGPGEVCDDAGTSDQCTDLCGRPGCGDGIVNGEEECDEGDDNSLTGACLPSCRDAFCGDGNIEQGVEACDTKDVQLCPEPFDAGTIACIDACGATDETQCSNCGNGVRDGKEQCDRGDLGGQTCASSGFDGGDLACNMSCALNTGGCFSCGDMVANGAEDCDGDDLDGETCNSVNSAFYENEGMLACAACTFDVGGCERCGDNVINGPEDCDGVMLGGQTCVDEGFAQGTLACLDCSHDTSGCCNGPTLSCEAISCCSPAVCMGLSCCLPDDEPCSNQGAADPACCSGFCSAESFCRPDPGGATGT